MEVIKFYGRFFGDISPDYGCSGYFQSHTKAKYPPGSSPCMCSIFTPHPWHSLCTYSARSLPRQCPPTACVWSYWNLYPSRKLPAYRLNIIADYSQFLRNCSLCRIISIMCKSKGYFLTIYWHLKKGGFGSVLKAHRPMALTTRLYRLKSYSLVVGCDEVRVC